MPEPSARRDSGGQGPCRECSESACFRKRKFGAAGAPRYGCSRFIPSPLVGEGRVRGHSGITLTRLRHPLPSRERDMQPSGACGYVLSVPSGYVARLACPAVVAVCALPRTRLDKPAVPPCGGGTR